MREHEVIVEFGSSIDSDIQGRSMLYLERFLREHGVAAEVFKKTQKDDSKLRVRMTESERAKL